MPTTSYRPFNNRGSNTWCCCIDSWFWCLYTTMAFIIIGSTLFIIIVFAIFRPSYIKVHVENASLAQFNLTNDNTTLHYNLTISMSFRNPSKKVGVYYDRLEFRPSFREKRFDSVRLPTFYQRPKNTTFLQSSFVGQQYIELGSKDLREYYKQKDEGIFQVEVKMRLKIRDNYDGMRFKKRPDVFCRFWVPLVNDGSFGNGFSRSRCGVDYHEEAG